jgi:hypothetical protein
MKATTVKIDGELLEEIERVKPVEQSVSAFVRSVLRKDLDRERARTAAGEYVAFLEAHPDEADWLAEWAAADLASPARQDPES